MAEVIEEESTRQSSEDARDHVSSYQSSFGTVSCDDEGYETAGKKTLSTRPKATSKEGRKSHDECSADDDGYETAGKKELVPARLKSGEKQGRKSRGGSISPRPESKDRTRSPPEQETKEGLDFRVHKLVDALEGVVTVDQLNNNAVELLKLVPDGYIPLPHQVGGHRHIDGKVGFLRRVGKPHLLYKPVQEGSKGVREVSFYDSLFNISSSLGTPRETFPTLCGQNEEAHALLQIIPKYYGLTTITDRAGTNYDYLVLEDITQKFQHPCIMDLKIGKRVWDDHADQDKIDREKKKYPAQEILGFRIIGMRTYKPDCDEYVYYDRRFGCSVTKDSAKEALSHFFEVGDGTYRIDVIRSISSKLTAFVDWIEKQDILRMFATSLLMVYEGGKCPAEDQEPGLLDIRLVDFAHCYEQDDISRPDGNALYGVHMFMDYLQQMEIELSK